MEEGRAKMKVIHNIDEDMAAGHIILNEKAYYIAKLSLKTVEAKQTTVLSYGVGDKLNISVNAICLP